MANHVGMFNPSHVNRACFRIDLLCPHTRCTVSTENMLILLLSELRCADLSELSAVACCSVNKLYFSKDAAPLLGDCARCRDAAALQTQAGSI